MYGIACFKASNFLMHLKKTSNETSNEKKTTKYPYIQLKNGEAIPTWPYFKTAERNTRENERKSE